MEEHIDDLSVIISKLAIELSETAPDTELYEQRSMVLADWLRVYDSMTDSKVE